jgi:hypothetical protein
MTSKEQIRLILNGGRDSDRQILVRIPFWLSEADRLRSDLARQKAQGQSTRATSAAAAVLIEVVEEERKAFREALARPGLHPDPDTVESACDSIILELKSIEADANPLIGEMLRPH